MFNHIDSALLGEISVTQEFDCLKRSLDYFQVFNSTLQKQNVAFQEEIVESENDMTATI